MTLEQKLQAGTKPFSGTTILHTAPHHDDILLGYFPYAVRNLADNKNHVLYLTSGANGVSDLFCARYHGIAIEEFHLLDTATKIELKSRIRELESEKKWSMVSGKNAVQIKHLRAGFYMPAKDSLESMLHVNKDLLSAEHQAHKMRKADCAESVPVDQEDIDRVVDYLTQIKPDIITVLVDEPGCGPHTHHQAAALMFAAIAQYQSCLQAQGLSDEIMMLGYRNIWSSFTPEQASIMVPVSLHELDLMQAVFQECFISQCQNFIMQDDGHLMNFAEQATSIFVEQGRLIGIDQPIIFLQKL